MRQPSFLKRISNRSWHGCAVATLMLGLWLTPALVPDAAADETDPDVRQFILANTEFSVVHELIHLLIDEIGFPVLGREEDIADHLAIMLLLTRDHEGPLPQTTIDQLQAVIDAWRIEWTIIEQDQMEIAYSDPHSLEIQRLYDLSCLAYGRDPDNLKDFAIANEIPIDRAILCPEDFQKAEKGLNFLQNTFRTDNSGNQITITFDKTETPKETRYKKWLTDSPVIRSVIAQLDRQYRFPEPVEIVFRTCGQSNAYWEPADKQIVVCYGLMDRFVHLARFRQEYAIEPREWALGVARAKSAFQ